MDGNSLYSPNSLEDAEFDSISPNDCSLSGYLQDFEFDFNQNSSLTQSPSLSSSPCHDNSSTLCTEGRDDYNDQFRPILTQEHKELSFKNDTLNGSSNQNFNTENAPFKICITQSGEENQRRNYPVGDSNSKNAIAARDNRLKKKKYIAELEQTVEILRTDNEILSKEVHKNKNQLVNLENEVKYLKSVIANQSTLSAILNSVSRTQGISLYTSFAEEKSEVVNYTSDRNSKLMKQSCKKTIPNDFSNQNLKTQRNLRSKSKIDMLQSKALKCGVQNMSPEEIVQCCKDQKKTKKSKFSQSECESSETDSNTEDAIIDIDDSNQNVSQLPGDMGGVCLHVTGDKVSLEFCSACNLRCNTNNVSLDHPYVRK